jgi:hypothetical protein
MAWNVEHTDEFEEWYFSTSEDQQEDITAAALLLEEQGPKLPYPYSSGINGSRHTHMRELRGCPIRIFYARGVRRSC